MLWRRLSLPRPCQRAAFIASGARLQARLDDLGPAPHHHENLLRFPSISQTGLFNVMQLPATAVPVGLSTAECLPLGCQVVAGTGHDRVSIAVACALQGEGIARCEPPAQLPLGTR
jgi:hypothetical protein